MAEFILDNFRFSSNRLVKGRGKNGIFGITARKFYFRAVRISF